MDFELPDRKALEAAWDAFVENGTVPSPDVLKKEIIDSWIRCREYGLDPYVEEIITGISPKEQEELLEKNNELIFASKSIFKSLYETMRSLEFVLFLTDETGFILNAIGSGVLWEMCHACNAMIGSSFHEKYAGTNAPWLSLMHDKPFQMIAEEHYCGMAHIATCAAAPIHDEKGRVIASLDLTTAYEVYVKHPYTLGMITAAAEVIENQLKLQKESERSFLARQYLEASMETMEAGVVILNSENKITHLNPEAERILGISISTVMDKHIESIIKNEIMRNAVRQMQELQDHELILRESIRKSRCIVNYRPISSHTGKRMGSVFFIKELRKVQELVKKVVGLDARYTLDDIKGDSEAIIKVKQLARSIAGSPSSVIIIGESGTGKEMVAQGIHNAGPNSDGPFLGINCAAVPRDLIESELFGYEAGTFTGAARGGKSGKLELANQGTLFLDEINGMSLDMQAKLLRVIEEKKFQRLGGSSFIHLDARIIAATNKDLKDEIDNSSFRSDLYFRLNTFEIHMPPLRDRGDDIALLAKLFCKKTGQEIGKKIIGIESQAINYLKQCAWPGNIRQLRNWIERAVNLAKTEILTINEFPEIKGNGIEPFSPQKDPFQSKYSNESSMFRLDEMEREVIRRVLHECNFNLTKASRKMGIGRTTLYRKMKKYELNVSKEFS